VRKSPVRSPSVPLHAMKQNIDYGFSETHTVSGKTGVQYWVCRQDRIKMSERNRL
jgi:small subunit ribosomal protein S3